MQSPGYDHLGLLLDLRSQVDELLEASKKFQATDDRMKIEEYDDLVTGPVNVRAFYVKLLPPIWFDIQHIAYEHGSEPARRWHYA